MPFIYAMHSLIINHQSSNPNAWVAPEHYYIAKSMQRYKGELIIPEHSIFKYSRENPPYWMTGDVRIKTSQQ
jgi:hypothetical protein